MINRKTMNAGVRVDTISCVGALSKNTHIILIIHKNPLNVEMFSGNK